MKKIIALALCVIMALGLVACGEKEVEYKLGLGVVESAGSSATGNAQMDNTVAAVVTDAEGKIVMARIDVAQNKMNVEGGAVDTAAAFQTKMELGDAYGMAGIVDNNGDGVMLEWYEQAKAFEAYVVGKTADEVGAIETQEVNAHQIAVDEALLSAGCSMQITDFITAVVKAATDEQGTTFTAVPETFTLGVAATTTAAESTAAAEGTDGVVKMYSDYGAAVVADGKIIAALNDANQPDITVNVAGEIVATNLKGTKRELKEGYGMAPVGIDNDGNGVTKEWFEQSAAFSAYAVGKTASELTSLETQEVNAHFISTDAALLDAGCSIQIGGMATVIANAANYAR